MSGYKKPTEFADDTAQKAVGLEKPIECDEKILGSCQANEKCLLNEKTDRFECECEHDMRRISGVCRDYSKHSQSCEVFLNECGVNEECLPLNQRAKHGTCQCNIGYIRNQIGACLPVERFAIIENEPSKEVLLERKILIGVFFVLIYWSWI